MTHSELINLWPSLREFADDLGVLYGTAKAMRRRGKVPAEHWLRMVEAAKERGIDGVSLEVLAAAVAVQSLEAAE
jgi:hypothetical protein